MDEYEMYFGINSILNFIAQLILCITSLFYWLKSKSTARALMVLGSIVLLISMIAWPIFMATFSSNNDAYTLVTFQAVSGGISSIFAIIFAIGFAMNLLDIKKTK